MKTPWTDDHSRLVAEAAPAAHPASDANLDRVWTRVSGGLAEVPVRRRRKARVVVGAGVVVGVLSVSGLAAADMFSARTGEGPVDAEDLALGGPGETLDPAAPDFGGVLTEETQDIAFPSEASRDASLRRQLSGFQFDTVPGQSAVSTGALRAWVALDAVCAWADEWVDAGSRSDGEARSRAAAQIESALGWPAVTDIDPQPYSRPGTRQIREEDGSVSTTHHRDESQFFYLHRVVAAIVSSDSGKVAEALVSNGSGCDESLVPHLPMAFSPYAASH